jgi:hypothetical protein
MVAKDFSYKKIADLVHRFEEQYDSYRHADYNETLTRRDFIDPFFKALGWDIDNENGYAESYREVIHEDKLKIGKATKAPDYSFRLVGGKRLFFVEAKKPSVVIKDDIIPAYQVRRYGWSAKLSVSIITDFEEFAVYDCTKKPVPSDKAAIARIKYLTYNDYLKDFDFLWDTFSKERVLKGSFDKYLVSNASRKGTATVDIDFLESLDRWRTYLATSICLNNKELDEEEINFAVQQTIDRVIFLRIAEDRSVEPYGNLKDCIKTGNLYQNLFYLFTRADEKYNSGLFDFHKDKLSSSLAVDNKVIKTIINELYYPDCPYEFSVLPIEILGTAYEQFLGKQIKVDSGNRIKIEEKPSVRKAGGVYYTPQYIVDYIIQGTVGKLIEGKNPKEISKVKIADPACGSGSFLIGAYGYLLNYHKNYYTRNGKVSKGDKRNPLTPQGELVTAEKKRILLNNIYGVDIDLNAVEVTKLSLLLKCLEGETEASIAAQMKLFHERVLPTLDGNIKSGNSLIDTDYFDNELDFGDRKRVRPFNWKKAFPEVAMQNGFDAIIGNPPYIQLAMFDWFEEKQKKYLLKKFCSSMGRMNTFGFFIENGINLLTEKGKLGFIIPNTILTQEYYQELRRLILRTTHVDNIVTYEHLAFADAVVETATIILSKEKSKTKTKISFCNKKLQYEDRFVDEESFRVSYKNQFNVSHNEAETGIKTGIDTAANKTLGDLVEINQAIALKADRAAYLFDRKSGNNYKTVLDGREINRYQVNWNGKYLKYDVNAIHSCKREDIFTSREKIFFRRVSSSLIATLDTQQFYALNTLVAVNLKKNIKCDIRYILGVFNSRLMNFYYTKFLKSTKKVFSEIQARQIGQLPFIDINFKNLKQKNIHDEIVKNVNLLLKLNEELKNENLQSNIQQIQSGIDYTEEKINGLVFSLYKIKPGDEKIIKESDERLYKMYSAI